MCFYAPFSMLYVLCSYVFPFSLVFLLVSFAFGLLRALLVYKHPVDYSIRGTNRSDPLPLPFALHLRASALRLRARAVTSPLDSTTDLPADRGSRLRDY